MMPMANRLQAALDSAAFGYTQEELERDIIEIESISAEDVEETPSEKKDVKAKLVEGGKKTLDIAIHKSVGITIDNRYSDSIVFCS